MSELVNDLGRPISAPCPSGIFGETCREEDYRSWRKLAVMIRQCILEANWSEPGTKDLHATVLSWLKNWIDGSQIDSPVSLAAEMIRSQKDADPEVPEGGRFPTDLSWYSGEYDPSGPIFNNKTRELIVYIKTGKNIFDRARKAGAISKDSSCAHEIEISEDLEPSAGAWIKPVVYVAGGLGIVGFAVWAYTEIVRAIKSREAP